MSIITKKIFAGVLTTLTLAFSLGCGSSTNNDQGASFLAFGWSNLVDKSPNVSGLEVALAPDSPVLATANGLPLDGSRLSVGMALENRLSTQFIRVVRIDCSYDLQGASISIPDDSLNVSAVLAPTSETGTTESGANTTLGTESGNVAYIAFPVVSTDIISYLNVNRNSLPELPFRMTAVCKAVGITQAGDTIETNELVLPIYFFDGSECCTGATGETPGTSGGFQVGTSNGGGITFEDGSSSATAAP